MATRFYFRNTTASEPKPSGRQFTFLTGQVLTNTDGGGQDTANVIYPCDMSLTPGAFNRETAQAFTEIGAVHWGGAKVFISPALAAQTLTGTFAFVADFQEGNAAQNMNPYICVYVWKGDSGTRGVIINKVSTLEADLTIGTLQTFTFAAYTITDLVVYAGDRIVIEVVWYDNNTKTASYIHGFSYNGAVASGRESYLEFSMNIAFQSTTQSITKYGDGRVLVGQSATKLADGRIKKTQEATRLADGRVLTTQGIIKYADGTVVVGAITYEMTKYADGRIFKTMEMTKAADGRVKVENILTKYADGRVFKEGSVTKTADGRVTLMQSIMKTADGTVKNTMDITKTSMGRIAGGPSIEEEGKPWWYR